MYSVLCSTRYYLHAVLESAPSHASTIFSFFSAPPFSIQYVWTETRATICQLAELDGVWHSANCSEQLSLRNWPSSQGFSPPSGGSASLILRGGVYCTYYTIFSTGAFGTKTLQHRIYQMPLEQVLKLGWIQMLHGVCR